MPLEHSGSKAAVSRNISEMVRAGHPQDQAVAAALNNQRSVQHRSAGGPVVGLIRSPVPGRTDRLPIQVHEDSYVVPADIVSGWGQGNTEAGSQILDRILSTHHQRGVAMARGGRAITGRLVPIVAAGGEYVVPPHVVASMGGGSLSDGHKILDRMVRTRRTATARQAMKLPGPRQN